MINAKEASRITGQATTQIVERELERIEQSVRTAAELGYRKATVKGLINKNTRKTLEDAGYRVKLFDDQREGSWTEVYWGDYYE